MIVFSLNPNFVFHLFQRLAALYMGETDSWSIERSSFSPGSRGEQVREEIIEKNIDEFNIFLSASIVEIKNNRLKSERFLIMIGDNVEELSSEAYKKAGEDRVFTTRK